MLLLLAGTVALVAIGLYLNWDLSRRQARQRWQAEMDRLAQAHQQVADRLVGLFDAFARTREGTGRTEAAFAAVQRAYDRLTAAFQPLDEEYQRIKEAFQRGHWAPLRERGARVREGLAGLTPLLDELQEQLEAFRRRWAEAPQALAAARQQVADLQAALAAASGELGFVPPVARQVEALADFLARVEAEAATNPVAALQRVADLTVRLPAVAEELAAYRSAAGALAQAQAELDGLAAGPAGADPQGTEALAQARAALAELRPHLEAGRLDHFQEALLRCQQHLREARRLLRQRGPVH